MNFSSNIPVNHPLGFLSGGQELSQLIRSFDWDTTPLGPINTWPQSLRSVLSICLNSNFPIAVYWGKDLLLLYNDAWSPIPGNKHPGALGQPAQKVWPDIWNEIEPQFAKAFSGQAGGSKDALLPMQRHGYTEECYFDFTFTPIYGEAGTVEGIFNAVIETTYRVVNERRTGLLKAMAVQLAGALTPDEVYQRAIGFFKDFSKDIPFAFLYSVDNADEPQFLNATLDCDSPENIFIKPLPFAETLQQERSVHITDLSEYLSSIPTGHWPELPKEGILTPVKTGNGFVKGFLFCGLSARLGYDEDYKLFIESVSNAIAAVLLTIDSLEEERKRSQALAEIDRAKTAFFTNISHEFRTPLTLLLGPVEECLKEADPASPTRERLELVYRNALRMQKLVNTLLEFSRLEAGRAEANYTSVDISAFTAGLAGTFRSAIEKAGMELVIDCSPIDGEVYVDPGMWEKIILNLVSNAFKYTLKGTITIRVKQSDGKVEVSVSDTGAGIPKDSIEHLFNRFYRIGHTPGRSQEGTGIGLALIKELIKLHYGTIYVESRPGEGSVFTVLIPIGKEHLPPDKVNVGAVDYEVSAYPAYTEEAIRWLPESPTEDGQTPTDEMEHESYFSFGNINTQYSVLVADDNSDMRAYIRHLLSDSVTVITAADGEEAYRKMLHFRPDLLISDIMMPGLDGFGLLRKVRQHPELRATPVIFLSARAGEEAKVEGLDAGADDYLVKPFSAKELIVRVLNHIRINQTRREIERQFYQLFEQAPALINVFKGPEHTYEFFHPGNKEIFGEVDFTGMKLIQAIPELKEQGIIEMLDEVYQSGKTIEEHEKAIEFYTKEGSKETYYFNFIYQPWYNINGKVQGVLNFAVDVTTQIKAQKIIEKSEQNLRNIITQAPVAMCIFKGPEHIVETANERMLDFWGKSEKEVLNRSVFEGLPEIKGQGFEELLMHVYRTGEQFSAVERPVTLLRRGKPESVYVNFVYEALRETDGTISGVMAVAIEVTEQVSARRKIEQAEEKARLAIDSADLGTYEVNLLTDELSTSERFNAIWGVTHLLPRKELASRIHPDDRPWREKAHRESRLTGNLHYEARVIWEDQSVHWIKINGKVLYDPSGKPTGLLGVIQDITEQKQFSEQLSRQVKERTLELQRSNEDLQQFAHVASHDLKEPVRKIKLFAGRLEDEFGHSLTEKGKVFIEKVQNAANRMTTMIDGVLAYSSLKSAAQPVESINLNEIIRQIETDVEVLISQKNAVIHADKLPEPEGAYVLIYQLFYNLITNALKFTKKDEPAIISITSPKEDTNEGYIKIVVSDNGIGFEPKFADRIFDTFTRLNPKDEYEGTGLGLSLCKKIVERHHGTITAEGNINQGAHFTVILPIRQTEKII